MVLLSPSILLLLFVVQMSEHDGVVHCSCTVKQQCVLLKLRACALVQAIHYPGPAITAQKL